MHALWTGISAGAAPPARRSVPRLQEPLRGQRHDGLADRVGRVLADRLRVGDPCPVLRVPGTGHDPAAEPAARRRERGLGPAGCGRWARLPPRRPAPAAPRPHTGTRR